MACIWNGDIGSALRDGDTISLAGWSDERRLEGCRATQTYVWRYNFSIDILAAMAWYCLLLLSVAGAAS